MILCYVPVIRLICYVPADKDIILDNLANENGRRDETEPIKLVIFKCNSLQCYITYNKDNSCQDDWDIEENAAVVDRDLNYNLTFLKKLLEYLLNQIQHKSTEQRLKLRCQLVIK